MNTRERLEWSVGHALESVGVDVASLKLIDVGSPMQLIAGAPLVLRQLAPLKDALTRLRSDEAMLKHLLCYVRDCELPWIINGGEATTYEQYTLAAADAREPSPAAGAVRGGER